jgi:hypothetical protein
MQPIWICISARVLRRPLPIRAHRYEEFSGGRNQSMMTSGHYDPIFILAIDVTALAGSEVPVPEGHFGPASAALPAHQGAFSNSLLERRFIIEKLHRSPQPGRRHEKRKGMRNVQGAELLQGPILIAALFLPADIEKIIGRPGIVQYIVHDRAPRLCRLESLRSSTMSLSPQPISPGLRVRRLAPIRALNAVCKARAHSAAGKCAFRRHSSCGSTSPRTLPSPAACRRSRPPASATGSESYANGINRNAHCSAEPLTCDQLRIFRCPLLVEGDLLHIAGK